MMTDVLSEDIWDQISDMLNKENIKIHEPVECHHINIIYNQKEGNEICLDCGIVTCCKIFDSCEWNNYKTDDGKFDLSSQRADIYISDNPYEIGGSIPGLNKNSLAIFIKLAKKYGVTQSGSKKQIAERLSSLRGSYLSKTEKKIILPYLSNNVKLPSDSSTL